MEHHSASHGDLLLGGGEPQSEASLTFEDSRLESRPLSLSHPSPASGLKDPLFVSPLLCCSLTDKPRKRQRLENSVYFLTQLPSLWKVGTPSQSSRRDPGRNVDFLKVPLRLMTGLGCDSNSTIGARNSEDLWCRREQPQDKAGVGAARCASPNSSCLGQRR